MKKFIFGIFAALALTANASEVIKIYSPYSPGHSGTPAMLRILEKANQSQSIYKFVLEFRPGGNQIIAVKAMDETSLSVIAPAYVENLETGKLNADDYRPVYAFGDACWAVVTNKPLKGSKEFVVGGVGYGNAAHLTALALGEKYGFDVRYVVFKSNNDALVNMAGNNGIEFVIDKYEGYEALQTKNPKMQMVAASCPTRLPQAPNVKTVRQLGIDAPYVFNIIIAHKDMQEGRRKAISIILNDATLAVGANDIFRLSAMRPSIFDNVSAEDFYTNSINQVKRLQNKYRSKIESAKEGK